MADERRRFFGFGVGALLPAVGFSLTWFCCLPIAAGALGVGIAGLGTKLMPLRPIFTTLSVLCLGVAFYQAYRPQSCERCSTSTRRQRLLVWLMAALIVALLTIEYWGSWVIYWTS